MQGTLAAAPEDRVADDGLIYSRSRAVVCTVLVTSATAATLLNSPDWILSARRWFVVALLAALAIATNEGQRKILRKINLNLTVFDTQAVWLMPAIFLAGPGQALALCLVHAAWCKWRLADVSTWRRVDMILQYALPAVLTSILWSELLAAGIFSSAMALLIVGATFSIANFSVVAFKFVFVYREPLKELIHPASVWFLDLCVTALGLMAVLALRDSLWLFFLPMAACMMTQHSMLHPELSAQVNEDTKTGIANVRGFNEMAEKIADRALREGFHVALFMIDVDNFKKINDTYGHPAGDEVLKEIAKRLIGCTRSVDLVARFGGEEFVVLTPLHAGQDPIDVGERLRSAVDRESFVLSDRTLLSVSVSVGCFTSAAASFVYPRDLIDDAVRGADFALYEAKRAGKNCVKVAT
jgi:diguanylate cyclase (GGDEF)-like protein